jgi:hypothetical protein
MKNPDEMLRNMMESLYGTTDKRVYEIRSNRQVRRNRKFMRRFKEIFKTPKGLAAKR